jgi:hypothetical protein
VDYFDFYSTNSGSNNEMIYLCHILRDLFTILALSGDKVLSTPDISLYASNHIWLGSNEKTLHMCIYIYIYAS